MQAGTALILENLAFSPFPFLALALAAALAPGRWRWVRALRWRGALALWLLLLVGASDPFFKAFSWPLRRLTPPNAAGKAEAIVVASAGIDNTGAPTIGSAIRSHTAGRLYLEGRAPLVLVTGGVTEPYEPHVDTKGMEIILLGMGVPRSAIVVEDRSVDTYMNGFHSEKILRERGLNRILLVSHDYHLPRLSAVFAKLGFEILPYAANTKATRRDKHWWRFLDWDNYNRLRTVAHEYVGLLAYKAAGKI